MKNYFNIININDNIEKNHTGPIYVYFDYKDIEYIYFLALSDEIGISYVTLLKFIAKQKIKCIIVRAFYKGIYAKKILYIDMAHLCDFVDKNKNMDICKKIASGMLYAEHKYNKLLSAISISGKHLAEIANFEKDNHKALEKIGKAKFNDLMKVLKTSQKQ